MHYGGHSPGVSSLETARVSACFLKLAIISDEDIVEVGVRDFRCFEDAGAERTGGIESGRPSAGRGCLDFRTILPKTVRSLAAAATDSSYLLRQYDVSLSASTSLDRKKCAFSLSFRLAAVVARNSRSFCSAMRLEARKADFRDSISAAVALCSSWLTRTDLFKVSTSLAALSASARLRVIMYMC